MGRRLAAGVLVALVIACGGGGSQTAPSPPPTTQPRPTTSILTFGVEGTPTFTLTSTSGGLRCGNYHVDFLMRESGGLRARLMLSDTWLREADGDISGRRVVDHSQDNVWIEAGGALRNTADRFHCSSERERPVVLVSIVEFRDANGNTHRLQLETGFEER